MTQPRIWWEARGLTKLSQAESSPDWGTATWTEGSEYSCPYLNRHSPVRATSALPTAFLLLREHLPPQVNSEGEKPLPPAHTSPVLGCCSSGQQLPLEGEQRPAPHWVQAQHVLMPEAPAQRQHYVHLPAEPMVPPTWKHPAPMFNQSKG